MPSNTTGVSVQGDINTVTNTGYSDIDQTGKVTSFLSKLNDESRVPRSPRTPDLIDLPGRVVRAPKTRHMTPRNSPDCFRETENDNLNGDREADLTFRLNQAHLETTKYSRTPYQPSNYYRASPGSSFERAPVRSDHMSSQHQDELTSRSLWSNTTRGRDTSLEPLAFPSKGPREYVIPKYTFDRSTSHIGFGANQASPSVNSPRSGLVRSSTTLGASASQQTFPSRQADMAEVRGGWNFRRMPTFQGLIPASYRLKEEEDYADDGPSPGTITSRYLTGTSPTSNALKNSDADVDAGNMAEVKPRIPMYWLYGSRGRPEICDDQSRDHWAHLDRPHTYESLGGIKAPGSDELKSVNLSGKDSFTSSAFGPSRANEHRPTGSSHVENGREGSVDPHGIKSILKKTTSYPSYPKATVPQHVASNMYERRITMTMNTGHRLSRLSAGRGTNKRVRFAF